MARYTIVIDLDGAAFAETITDARQEVARVLMILGDRLNAGRVSLIDDYSFIDANGNTCGRAIATLGPTEETKVRELSAWDEGGNE